jgi:hypothetical protein
VPLQWGAINLGVLDLARRAPGSLSGTQLQDVMSAADVATLMFLAVRTDPGDVGWMDHSVHSRVEIHQATGMVLAQLGVSTDRIEGHTGAAQLHDSLVGDLGKRARRSQGNRIGEALDESGGKRP